MPIALLRAVISIPEAEARSLKDKRRVARPLSAVMQKAK